MPKHETNVEFVTRMMEFCPTGALSQAFIIEAIGRYAKLVAENPPIPDTDFLSGEAWKRTGDWINAQMKGHLK